MKDEKKTWRILKDCKSSFHDTYVKTLSDAVLEFPVVISSLLTEKKPRYVDWISKYSKELSFSSMKTSDIEDEFMEYVNSHEYDIDSYVEYYECYAVRNLVSLTAGFPFMSLSYRYLDFDKDFFIRNVFSKYEPDAVRSLCGNGVWGTKEDDVMFWAIMTFENLEHIRSHVSVLKSEDMKCSILNEVSAYKHWKSECDDMNWNKLCILAGLEGKDEEWLKMQFSMWANKKILEKTISKVRLDWQWKFVSRPDLFGIPDLHE